MISTGGGYSRGVTHEERVNLSVSEVVLEGKRLDDEILYEKRF